ncbi:fanconi-associated nuclease 1 isoform X1 [Hypanus sabinus]|uniref:fanconi-associated nuclease 1 isoform X1 n=1 Tax=Hypanus sabinus TaxID=79690 RepID=UPI0028C43034|nr:fanconi-associated nuclease 1 isoform X1 [Hypanus sabinus]XP_059801814.1 fanconi-associated nuclease 1 isoform X1 [Hypanus sabinus]XP_059801815.1 fanconi-associated nuclease 1 isoform X1 [Hypanus sabinus]
MSPPEPKKRRRCLSLRERRFRISDGTRKELTGTDDVAAPPCLLNKLSRRYRQRRAGVGAVPVSPATGEAAASVSPATGEAAASVSPATGEAAASVSPATGEAAASVSPATGEAAASVSPATGEAAASVSPATGEAAASVSPATGEAAASVSPATGVAAAAGGGWRDAVAPPYYLANFLMVLDAVLLSPDAELLNEEDKHWIRMFRGLSGAAQKVYVRLFQRKLNWLRVKRLEYVEISPDLVPIINELALAGLVQTDADLHNVSDALSLLSAPELKLLAKHFHLRTQSQKSLVLRSLLQLAKRQSIFSLNQTLGPSILSRVKEMVGQCVRATVVARAVFSRLLLLFSLTEPTDDEDAACVGQNQLSTVLMVNMGRVTFPSYTVLREARIFQHREDLLRYDVACHTLVEVGTAMANKAWRSALEIYKAAKKTWTDLEKSSDIRFYRELPVYLRCFTAGWVYTRIRFRGVEILQRLDMYKEAVEELKSLLDQDIFCPERRGCWWDRLTLNLLQHLKQTDQAIHYLREGLADTCVHTGYRLALQQRALRIRDSPGFRKWHHLLQDLPVMDMEQVPHVMIKGRTCPGMGNAMFLLEEQADSTIICSVEAVSLAYYRQQGFDQGIHGEGATFLTLFGLLFWEIIFLPGIPDVFRSPFQTCPLDLYTDYFYRQRKEPIELRLSFLQDASTETLHTLIADVWNSHKDTANALVNWEIFSSLQQAQSLVSCLGGLFLSGICKILAVDLRHCRGGLPDLVVWNSQSLRYKLAEVKGPTDRLSHKQIVWLDWLRKLGAEVEVCHVSAVGARAKQLS